MMDNERWWDGYEPKIPPRPHKAPPKLHKILPHGTPDHNIWGVLLMIYLGFLLVLAAVSVVIIYMAIDHVSTQFQERIEKRIVEPFPAPGRNLSIIEKQEAIR